MPYNDPFGGRRDISAPGEEAFAITPSDGVDLATLPRYLYVGTGGDVVVVTKSGATVAFRSVPTGGYVLVRAVRVLSNGTTASNIVGIV